MSDVALLSFGCAVSFIVVAAVYIFVTEDFERLESAPAREKKADDREEAGVRKAT